jgi:hypothetical protein
MHNHGSTQNFISALRRTLMLQGATDCKPF